MVQEIAISLLGQHPKNPRKVYEDIDELAASIKEKGVLQNLTVVPDEERKGHYLVVIGNRRLAAARKAGIESLPCTISDMSEEEAVQIMLTENMQRKDLTPIEEAYGIQMCIQDFGIEVKDVAKKTGLSESTIYHRLNIAKLDREILKDVPAQVTMKEYQELEKIKNIEYRNEAAKFLGQPGFSQKVADIEKKEKVDNWKEGIRKKLDAFATKLNERNYDTHVYINAYWYGTDANEPQKPKDIKGPFFYTEADTSFTLLRLRPTEKEQNKEIDEEEQKERERKKEREAERRAAFKKYYQRRFEFIRSRRGRLTTFDRERHLIRATTTDFGYGYVDGSLWEELHGEEYDEERDIIAPPPPENERNITDYLYCQLEYGDRPQLVTWDGKYRMSEDVKELYSLLDDMGYVMDETEEQMLDGTWELYEEEDD